MNHSLNPAVGLNVVTASSYKVFSGLLAVVNIDAGFRDLGPMKNLIHLRRGFVPTPDNGLRDPLVSVFFFEE